MHCHGPSGALQGPFWEAKIKHLREYVGNFETGGGVLAEILFRKKCSWP